MDTTGRSHLTFGVELELVLEPTEKVWDKRFPKGAQWQDAGKAWRERAVYLLQKVVKPLHKNFGIIDAESDEAEAAKKNGTFYKTWTIANDPTIQAHQGQWTFEVVSRVLTLQENDWVELFDVWGAINSFFNVVYNDSCSTHVHLKRFAGGSKAYSPADLSNISKGVTYYEPAVREFIPPVRRGTVYAVSNIQGQTPINTAYIAGHADSKPFSTVFNALDHLADAKAISKYMCVSRSLAWNYNNIWDFSKTPIPTGTLEFRRPPQSLHPAATAHWASLALSFVDDFARNNLSRENKAEEPLPDVRDLPGMEHWGQQRKLELEKRLTAAAESLGLQKYLNLELFGGNDTLFSEPVGAPHPPAPVTHTVPVLQAPQHVQSSPGDHVTILLGPEHTGQGSGIHTTSKSTLETQPLSGKLESE